MMLTTMPPPAAPFLLSPARAPRARFRRHARRHAARDLRARAASPRAGSRLYEATAKNLLRVTIELVGAVPPRAPVEGRARARRRQARRAQGRRQRRRARFDRGLRLLAALAARRRRGRDPGSRVYLDAFVAELVRGRALPEGSRPGSVDELLGALEGVSGTGARLIDIPPLEVAALRRSLADIRRDAAGSPRRRSSHASSTASARWRDASARACSRSPSGSVSPSSTRPGTSDGSTFSTRTART